MTDKELNKEICKELQKLATFYFDEISDDLKNFGNSFTTYELCRLSDKEQLAFGIELKVVEAKEWDMFGNECIKRHLQYVTGKRGSVCVGDFSCDFDLSNIFHILHKFEKLSRTKHTVFAISNESTIQEAGVRVIKIEDDPVSVAIDSSHIQEPERVIPDVPAGVLSIYMTERPITVSMVERPTCNCITERLRIIPSVPWSFLITNKGMYYLTA